MASQSQINALTGLYIGYFNRSPDPAGLQFWINQIDNGRDFTTIAQDFAGSDEATSLYPYLNNGRSAIDFISTIYQNLFNRLPEPNGLGFWYDVLTEGTVSAGDMIEAILNGATGDDAKIVANKIEAAYDWTTSVPSKVGGFTFDAEALASAKATISSITIWDASVDAAKAQTDIYVAGTQENSLPPVTDPNSFTLLASGDIGIVDLERAFETIVIDGDDNVQGIGAEIGDIVNGSDTTIRNADFDGRRLEINTAEETGPVEVTLRLVNIDQANVFANLDGSGDGSSSADTVNLFLDNVQNTDGSTYFYTTDAETFNVTVLSDSDLSNIGNFYNNDRSGFGPANVNLIANADLTVGFWDLSDTGGVTTDFNITGAGDVLIRSFDDFASDVTVDGSTATGNLELRGVLGHFESITTGSGNDTIQLSGSGAVVLTGSGNDTIIGASGNDIITGGTGVDTITGSLGSDTFVLDQVTAGNNSNITDFVSGSDKIQVSVAVFDAAADGTPLTTLGGAGASIGTEFTSFANAAALTGGSVALSVDAEMFIHLQDTGIVYFNNDGNAAGGFIEIGTVGVNSTLVDGDWTLIA